LQTTFNGLCDYSEILPSVGAGDFVYMDPPYAAEKPSSFVGYTADGFGEQQSQQLFQLCQDAANRGVYWLLSNSDVPVVRRTFANSPNPAVEFVTEVVVCRRRIHAKKPESVANEVLISWRTQC
jgi:DNA adenine methylase